MIPIIVFYAIGFIVFLFSLEKDEKQSMTDIIYPAMSFFINIMGYFISYQDNDYVLIAYFPLAMLMMSVLILLYRIYQVIQPMLKGDSWESDNESDFYNNKEYNPMK